jgi:hypothetical protein
MKNLTFLSISIIGLIVLSYLNPVAAEERFIEIEMVDGNTVSFPLTAEEIAAEDAKKEILEAIRKAKSKKKLRKRYVEIEMADGNTVSFPMTAAEIAAEDAKMAKLDILKKKRSITPKKEVILVEMADGNFAEFPVKTKDNTTSNNAEKNGSDQNS